MVAVDWIILFISVVLVNGLGEYEYEYGYLRETCTDVVIEKENQIVHLQIMNSTLAGTLICWEIHLQGLFYPTLNVSLFRSKYNTDHFEIYTQQGFPKSSKAIVFTGNARIPIISFIERTFLGIAFHYNGPRSDAILFDGTLSFSKKSPKRNLIANCHSSFGSSGTAVYKTSTAVSAAYCEAKLQHPTTIRFPTIYSSLQFVSFTGPVAFEKSVLQSIASSSLNVRTLIMRNGLSQEVSLVGSFPELTILDLSSNQMTRLPAIDTMTNLQILNLARNSFSSRFPSSITKMRNLELLNIGFNHFTHSIPCDIGRLTRLTWLDVSENRLLNGSIPDSISKLRKLQYIDVSGNSFSGVLPTGLDQPELVVLYLTNNNFQGTFSRMCSFRALQLLDASVNHFSGRLPPCFLRNVTSGIKSLGLSQNQFTGPIPDSIIHASSSLSALHLDGNQFTGVLPNVTSWIQMSSLWLSHNQFNGTIPESWCTFQAFQDIKLANLSLSGKIPKCIGNLSNLEVLDISYNALTQTLPESLSQLQALTQLSLGYNQLNGSIPSIVLPNLKYLHLYQNQFTSDIPSTIGLMNSLVELDLSWNALTGRIPDSIGNLTLLQTFILSANHLTGVIPASLQQMTSLTYIDLHNNSLTGFFPSGLNNLTRLKDLELQMNHVKGTLPSELALLEHLVLINMQGNRLSHIPIAWKDSSISQIWLGGNRIRCDCVLLSWFGEWSSHGGILNTSRLVDSPETTCGDQNSFFGREISAIRTSEKGPCDEPVQYTTTHVSSRFVSFTWMYPWQLYRNFSMVFDVSCTNLNTSATYVWAVNESLSNDIIRGMNEFKSFPPPLRVDITPYQTYSCTVFPVFIWYEYLLGWMQVFGDNQYSLQNPPNEHSAMELANAIYLDNYLAFNWKSPKDLLTQALRYRGPGSKQVIFTTAPEAPEDAPTNIRYLKYNRRRLQIQWNPPSQPNSDVHSLRYLVQVTYGDGEIASYDASQTFLTIDDERRVVPNTSYSIRVSAYNEFGFGKFSDWILFSTLPPCEAGFIYDNATDSCDKCPNHFVCNGDSASPCPTGAECLNGSSILSLKVLPGYWRASKQTMEIRKCRFKSLCLPNSVSSPSTDDSDFGTHYCTSGSTGVLCEQCIPNYGVTNTTQCVACSDTDVAFERNSFIAFWILLPFLSLIVLLPISIIVTNHFADMSIQIKLVKRIMKRSGPEGLYLMLNNVDALEAYFRQQAKVSRANALECLRTRINGTSLTEMQMSEFISSTHCSARMLQLVADCLPPASMNVEHFLNTPKRIRKTPAILEWCTMLCIEGGVSAYGALQLVSLIVLQYPDRFVFDSMYSISNRSDATTSTLNAAAFRFPRTLRLWCAFPDWYHPIYLDLLFTIGGSLVVWISIRFWKYILLLQQCWSHLHRIILKEQFKFVFSVAEAYFLILVYAPCCALLLAVFQCHQFSDTLFALASDPTVICKEPIPQWSNEASFQTYRNVRIASLCLFFPFALGLPLYCAWLIATRNKTAAQVNDNLGEHTAAGYSNKVCRQVFYEYGYQEHSYWMAPLNILYRIWITSILPLILVVSLVSSPLQLISLLVFSFVWFLLTGWLRPHQPSRKNTVVMMGQLMLCFTCFCGVLSGGDVITPPQDYQGKYVFTMYVLVPYCAVTAILMFLWIFILDGCLPAYRRYRVGKSIFDYASNNEDHQVSNPNTSPKQQQYSFPSLYQGQDHRPPPPPASVAET